MQTFKRVLKVLLGIIIILIIGYFIYTGIRI